VGGFLRFGAFFVLLLAAFVLIGLPLLLGPLLTQTVRNSGLDAQTIDVSVGLFDPTLLLGRARKVTLTATNIQSNSARIGSATLSVGDANYFDRTFRTVSGDLSDVQLTASGGETMHVESIAVDGPADAANATAHLSATDTDRLIRVAAERVGLQVDAVDVGDQGVNVTISGLSAKARLAVTGGALVLDPGVGGSIVLFQPAPSDPWKLEEAYVTADGLNVRAQVDVGRLAKGAFGKV
jgi:hypothetical protein